MKKRFSSLLSRAGAEAKGGGVFIVSRSNVFPPYQGKYGELFPCLVTDEHGTYVTAIDIPAVIWDSLDDA